MNIKPVLAWAWAALLVCGCGKADTTCHVSGQVQVNNQPASGVYVVLHAADNLGGPSAGSGRTNGQGEFTLQVPKPGEYALTVFWPQLIEQPEETIEGPDRLGGRYRNPQQPLRTVAVSDKQAAMEPLQLKLP